jgi:hypothetical protein
MGRTRTDPTPQECMSGWHGRRWREQPEGARVNSCIPPQGVTILLRVAGAFAFIFPFLTFSCKGGSHPETCAQRTAEGGGFLMLW